MKKSTKIILPALAVLVLGTAAAATGTVAWFASNGVVEAKGMHVQCSTAKNLLISNIGPTGGMTEGTNYGTSVLADEDPITELSPSSTAKSTFLDGNPNFFYTDGTIDAVQGTVKEKTAETAGTKIYVGEQGNGKQYVKYSFWLMAQAVDNLDLSIESISFSAVNEETGKSEPIELNDKISQALRMGIYYVDTTTTTPKDGETVAKNGDNDIGIVRSNIFNLGEHGDTPYYGFNGGDITPTTESDTNKQLVGELTDVALDTSTTPVTTTTCKIGDTVVTEKVEPGTVASIKGYSLGQIETQKEAAELSASKWHEVDLYFWYEGQDSHCTANSALDIQGIDISVKFQAVAATK